MSARTTLVAYDTTCAATEALLPAHRRGSLDPDTAAAVAVHVATCEECGRSWRMHRALSTLRQPWAADVDAIVNAVLARIA